MKKAIVFILMLFAVSVFAQTKTKNVRLSEEFTLAAKEKAAVKSAKLNIEFVSVTEDSRCPVDVDCVWAGNAKVQIKISKGKAAAQTFELNTNLDPKTITIQGYQIKLVSLDPAPKADTETAKRKYAGKFIVQK